MSLCPCVRTLEGQWVEQALMTSQCLDACLSCISSFLLSDKFTRFCQWKNVELNIHVSGFGELACQGTSAPPWGLCGEEGQCWDPRRRGWRKVCLDHRSRRPWYQGLSLLPKCLCCGAEEACSDPGCCHSAADHE